MKVLIKSVCMQNVSGTKGIGPLLVSVRRGKVLCQYPGGDTHDKKRRCDASADGFLSLKRRKGRDAIPREKPVRNKAHRYRKTSTNAPAGREKLQLQ